MKEREDDDETLSDLAAIAPDARLAREVVEIAMQRENSEPPEADETPEAGREPAS